MWLPFSSPIDPQKLTCLRLTRISEKRQFETLCSLSWLGCARTMPCSLDEFVAKHRKAAFGGLARCLILEHVPMRGQHPILDANNVRRNPIHWQSDVGKPAMNDDVVTFCKNHPRLILERRRRGFDQIEEALPARRDVGAVLNVVGRPELLGRSIVALIEKRVECFKNKFLVFRFNRLLHLVLRCLYNVCPFFPARSRS